MPPIVQYSIYLLVAAAVVVLVRSVQASIREKGEAVLPTLPDPLRPPKQRPIDGRLHSTDYGLRQEPRPPLRRQEGEMRREHALPPGPGQAPESAMISLLRQEPSVEVDHPLRASSRIQPLTRAFLS